MWIFFSVLEHGIITVNLIPRAIRAVQIRFLVVQEDLTPFLGLNATEKMKLLTVHKENFVNVVESASNDLTVKYAGHVFNKRWEHFLVKFIFKCILTVTRYSSC